MNKVKMIKCCQCEKDFNYFSSDFRPFCSERCKMIDLGEWFNESYTIPSPIQTPEELDEYEMAVEKKMENDEY